MRKIGTLMPLGCAIAVLLGISQLEASTVTGTLAADNSIYSTTLTLPTMETLTAYTTSYAGGMNLDATSTSGGGFAPLLTLFSVSTGNVAALSSMGTPGNCGMAGTDSATGLCNDAYLNAVLGAGQYVLDLTEFPNVANGGINDGFLAGSDANFTGTNCSGTGQFLESDVAPCVQRTNAYTLNISTSAASPVPEPATLWFAAGALLAAGLIRRSK